MCVCVCVLASLYTVVYIYMCVCVHTRAYVHMWSTQHGHLYSSLLQFLKKKASLKKARENTDNTQTQK